jgi:hypothetical protein
LLFCSRLLLGWLAVLSGHEELSEVWVLQPQQTRLLDDDYHGELNV